MEDVCTFEAELTDEGVCITLSGKLVATTATGVDKEISALGDELTAAPVTFDLAGLESISSAGLRVLMRLQQRLPHKLTLMNVTGPVYEIFAMTGITEMMNVERGSIEVDVDGCQVVGRGASGVVYRLDADTVVKLYPAGYPTSALVLERESARIALIKGVPTAIPLYMVRAGERCGLAYELVDARSLQSVIVSDPDGLEGYLDGFSDLFRRFHTARDDAHVFSSAKDVLLERLGTCERYYGGEVVAQMRDVVERIPESDTVLHGDFHPGNVLVDGQGEYFVLDLGDISYGHPVFDLMSLALHYPSLYRHAASRKLCTVFHGGMTPELHERVWDGFIDRTFADRSADERARISILGEQLAACLEAVTPVRVANLPEDQIAVSVAIVLEKWPVCYEALRTFEDFDLFL